MRMVYASGTDEGAFQDARARLLGRFARWAREQGRDIETFAVGHALDFKRRYGDGRLGHWTAATLHQLLCEWFPREVTLPEPDRAAVLPALHAWVDFLQAAGLGDPRSDDQATLHRTLDELAGEFSAAMDDRSRYGLGKFWATTMLDQGVDPADEDAVQRFIEDLHEGLVSYDDSALSSVLSNGAGPPVPDAAFRLAPARLAPESELAEEAAASPVVRRIRSMTAWAAGGRTLTRTGRLKLADARHLVGLLGTSDVMDPVIGDRVFKTSTSEELYELDVTFRWAQAVRAVRVVKGRLVPVKKNARVLDRPLELWERAFTALPDLGPTVCGRGYVDSLLARDFAMGLQAVLIAMYTQGRFPWELLRELVWDALSAVFRVGDATEEQRWLSREMVDADLLRLLRQLEQLGAVRAVPAAGQAGDGRLPDASPGSPGPQPVERAAPWGLDLAGERVRESDTFELTPLGVWGVRRRLQALGLPAPAVGDLSGEPLEVVIDAAAGFVDFQVAEDELAAWCAANGEEVAAVELAALIRRTDAPEHRMLAFHALGYTGESGVEAARGMRDDPSVGAYAGAWLVNRGFADPGSLTPGESGLAMVETLAALRSMGPGAIVETLAGFGSDGEQASFVDNLWRVEHPQLISVLDAIAEAHPDAGVARAARKAQFRARSSSN